MPGFSLLPELALQKIFSFLDLKDTKNMKLVSQWWEHTLMCLEPKLRKWKIRINFLNFGLITKILSAAYEKRQNSHRLKLKNYEIDLDVSHDSLGQMLPEHRLDTIKAILPFWSDSITALKLAILGDEILLVDIQFPQLTSLSIKHCSDFQGTVIMRGHEDRISSKLIDNSMELDTLQIKGDWNLSLGNNTPKMKSLKVMDSSKKTLDLLFQVYKDSLTVLELNNYNFAFCEEGEDLSAKLPQTLNHLVIDGGGDESYQLVKHYSSSLLTLKITNYYGNLIVINVAKLNQIKLLWLEGDTQLPLLSYCNPLTLEHLILTYQDQQLSVRPRFPSLRSLTVRFGVSGMFLELLNDHYQQLEMLCIVDSNFSYLLEFFKEKVPSPNMKLILLRELSSTKNLITLNKIFPSAKIITGLEKGATAMYEYASKNIGYSHLTEQFTRIYSTMDHYDVTMFS